MLFEQAKSQEAKSQQGKSQQERLLFHERLLATQQLFACYLMMSACYVALATQQLFACYLMSAC
jgi:hypothetical protein